jgi:2-polyprenyl-3-methyl-5-hydroxy-6-metoxy-1,4-benzoquinol methylase
MEMTTNELDPYYQEYTSRDAILKYSKATAGYGISYLLDHDYKRVYLDALHAMQTDVRKRGLQMLEFGCGAGMNLVHLISVLNREGIKVKRAVGTDFSPALIDAAWRESRSYLPKEHQGKVEFYVAKNETLADDLGSALRQPRAKLLKGFDFILGVNTARYCHRSDTQVDCARDIFDLLAPGGVCVNIDMNNRFLFFRSSLKRGAREQQRKGGEAYIPSLDEYAKPFSSVGFEILRQEHFCWVPHSASSPMCVALSALSPMLSLIAKSRAMRSLVVARKPVA